jgi:hypothetical protein
MYSNGQKSQGRTLWIWDTLPKKGLLPDDQKWLNEGDAVENVHRLNLGNDSKIVHSSRKIPVPSKLIFRPVFPTLFRNLSSLICSELWKV